jgi:hypothetical protein
MKTWAQFYDYIMPSLPGVSAAAVDVVLRDKTIEFCEQTWALTDDLDPIPTVAGQYEYPLDATEPQTEVFAVKTAWVDSEPIAPETMDVLWAANRDWRTYQGKPLYYAQRDFQNVLLYPVPDGVYSVDLVAVLRPTLASTGVPDKVFTDYRQIISAGVLGVFLQQSDKPWSNPSVGSAAARQFSNGVTAATVTTTRGRARATLQVRFRRI